MSKAVKIGILFSTEGPYAALGRECRDGALFAIEQEEARNPGLVEPVSINPNANLADYLEGARSLLKDHGCRNIIGTVTSIARKEIIPLVEKHDGLLWYILPYEGFEANANVIYTGACPNQHLVPLFDYLLPRYGKRPYLVGANYIWGWEMNRLARELIQTAGGDVLGERYLPLEETAVERIVQDIKARRPSFILNNLIGPSSYAFLAAIRALGNEDPAFLPENCPVVSCDLTECELDDVGQGVATGQLSAACYFDGVATAESLAFKQLFHRRFGHERQVSSIFASAFAATKLCLQAIAATGSDDPAVLKQHLYQTTTPTVLGPIRIDPETHHAALPFLLGRINAENGFDIIASQPALAADPYLTGRRTGRSPQLRIVS